MFPEPEYAQNVIVGIIFQNMFAWYVTEKDYWYLDFTRYDRALLAAGYESLVLTDYSERFDIAILDQDKAELFLLHVEDRRVPTNALYEMMLVQRQMYEEHGSLNSLAYYNAILNFIPCFLVDFDQRHFSSLYPEMIRFELYVPDGWIGTYKDFRDEIPEEERYWIADGHDMFQ